jgi:signal transduction histidine kinase
VRWRAGALDAAVAVGSFALSAVVLATSDPAGAGVRDPDAGAYVLAALHCGSPLLRRRSPVVAVAAGMLTWVGFAAAKYPEALVPVVLLSVYSAAVGLPQKRARLVLAGALVVGLLAATFTPGPTDLTEGPALILASWLLGQYVGSRRAYTAELERKNRLLEEARLELADRAVTEERLRIARELHDVVAHTMSVVAVQAGSGRMVAEDDPVAARQSLATIETATRSALAEMRRLLGVLRGAGPEKEDALAPVPGLGGLDALVADVVKSGVTVDVRVEGERRDVPRGVDLSAYRIVQEALTNVMKHAGPTRVSVAVRYSDDSVTVEIDDEGPAPQRPVTVPSGGGHGLVGMQERVAMYHGQLVTGPRPAGGFHVAARLPFGEAT